MNPRITFPDIALAVVIALILAALALSYFDVL